MSLPWNITNPGWVLGGQLTSQEAAFVTELAALSPSDGDIFVYRTAGGEWTLEAKPAGGSNPAWGDITGTLSNQTDLQAALDAKIGSLADDTTPQLGGDLDANGSDILNVPMIDFDTTATTDATIGQIRWNNDHENFVFGVDGESVALDQEFYFVRNNTGSTITKGSVVYANGTVGASGRITIAKMIADGSVETARTLGVVLGDIANGADGIVVSQGVIRGVDTSAFTDGDILFVSPTTAGAFTATQPTAPDPKLPIAFVIYSHATTGSIAIRVQPTHSTSEINDIYINSIADKNALLWNNTNSRWENRVIVEADISDLGAYITSLTDDTSPQLGGALDVNGQKIVSTSNGDIDIEPNGTGNVLLGNYTFDADQTVGAGQDNYVLTYDNGTGLISLEAAPGAGGGDAWSDPVDADIVPDADGTRDLGSSTNRFAQLHVDNVYLGAFGAATFYDNNNNEIWQLNATASAVNFLAQGNSSTGNPITLEANGDDTNVSIDLQPKGSGEITVAGQKVIDETDTASDTAAGIVELATTAETNTGTDATRAVTPDALADSKFGNSSLVSSINFVIDGGGSAITTGVKGFIEVPFACTINQVTLLADQSGSIVVDIWKDSYANYPPTDADSITASAVPTISSATKAQDATLTGWTTSVSAGDILGFNVDSATTVERVTVSLKVTRS